MEVYWVVLECWIGVPAINRVVLGGMAMDPIYLTSKQTRPGINGFGPILGQFSNLVDPSVKLTVWVHSDQIEMTV